MRAFELDIEVIAALVALVRGDRASPDDDVEAFARIAWTVLVEPGDQTAGQLIAALSPRRALEHVLAGDPAAVADVWVADGIEPVRALRIASDAFERWRPRVAARPVVRAIEQAGSLGIGVVLPSDPDWPSGFAALGPAEPIAMWVRGDRARLAEFDGSIAVVGARAATGYGDHVATEIAGGLGDRGVAVVSGGAYGIDAAAHRAALASGATTLAFLAGGLDRYYPAGNSDLLARVAGAGLVIAEVPPGVPPTRSRFLTRNRLLAAASSATVVVEAGIRSGSLNTANHALAIGRPVGAVPGPVTSPTSAGCHRLLRESEAVCITCAEDAIELAGGDRTDSSIGYDPVDADVVRVLDELGVRRGRTTEDIARTSGMTRGAALAALGPLELAGVVRRVESGWIRVPGAT